LSVVIFSKFIWVAGVLFFLWLTEYTIEYSKEKYPDHYKSMREAPVLMVVVHTLLILFWPIYLLLIIFSKDE